MAVTPEVAVAIDEIRTAFPEATLTVREDGQGGAHLVIDGVPLGEPYRQEETWVGFHITHLHPKADVYPHHVRGDLSRIDGAGLGTGTSSSTYEGRPSVQLSRRSNRRDVASDSAVLKLVRVIDWLRSK